MATNKERSTKLEFMTLIKYKYAFHQSNEIRDG